MSASTETETSAPDPYDVVPYGGRAVPLSHPGHLAIAALRRGMTPALPEGCRLLELGCAEGANIVPMAYHDEGARFVGVDASSVQIEVARDKAARLGLDNLELLHARIESLDASIGEFDYIVAHGVFSWVSDPVRERMLTLIRERLAPSGVAYLSFNCAPGWSIRSEMRRALLRGVEGEGDPARKLARVRELLTMFVGSPLRESPYGALLAEEAARALAHPDAYLLHEYLADENRAFYYGEVAAMARAHGLELFHELGTAAPDARIERGLVQGLTETLSDATRAEELTELMLFRAFRMALLRRADAPVGDAQASVASLAKRARFAGALRPEVPRISLDEGVHETFLTADAIQLGTSSALLKAALLEVGKSWPSGLGLGELVERAELLLTMRRVIDTTEALDDGDRTALVNDLLELGELGHLELRLREPPPPTSTLERPRVGALTRLEAERGQQVTTPLHHVVTLDPLGRQLVRHLDGTRSLDALVTVAHGLLQSEAVVLHDEEGQPLALDRVEALLPELVRRAVEALASHHLLV